MQWFGMSHGLFTFSLFLFSGHLAWRFSGEEEKEIYPFFTAFFSLPVVFFPFQHFVIVGR
jgi:hypothetical protein